MSLIFSLSTIIFDLELKQRVTGWQIDSIAFARIPAGDDQPARIRIGFDLINQTRNLIDTVAFRISSAEGTPEIAVHRAEVARGAAKPRGVLGVSPFLPNVHASLAQVCFVRITRKKPKQLFRDPAKRHLLGGDDRKAVLQIESRLEPKVGNRTDTGAIMMLSAMLENRAENVMVLLHVELRARLRRLKCGKALPFRRTLIICLWRHASINLMEKA